MVFTFPPNATGRVRSGSPNHWLRGHWGVGGHQLHFSFFQVPDVCMYVCPICYQVTCSMFLAGVGIHVGCLVPKKYQHPPSRYGAIGRSVGEGHLTWICNYYSGLQGDGLTEMDPVFADHRGIRWRFMVAASLSIHFLNDGTQTSKGKAILIWGWRWWDEEGTFTGL